MSLSASSRPQTSEKRDPIVSQQSARVHPTDRTLDLHSPACRHQASHPTLLGLTSYAAQE